MHLISPIRPVPFDKITDCDVVEPAGNDCFCVPRVLYTVHVDTASSSQERHELVLAGLKDPHNFKKLVWAMKRAQQNHQTHPPSIFEMTRGNSEDIATLLREIRDELRQNNEALHAVKNLSSSHAQAPSAPSEATEFV